MLCLEDCLVVSVRTGGRVGLSSKEYVEQALVEFDALKVVLKEELAGTTGDNFLDLLSSLRMIKALKVGLSENASWREIEEHMKSVKRSSRQKQKPRRIHRTAPFVTKTTRVKKSGTA